MSLYSTSVKRPITTLMVFVAMIVVGLYSLRNIPLDLYPEIEPPFISVFTIYPGAGASDIETNITRPLEDNLSTITNLKNITSVSRDNISAITIEFEYETNLDEATNEIRDVIGRIQRFLPEDIEQPTIFKFSSSMIPVMVLSATAEESYPALAKILDYYVVNPLNRIDGVGTVVLYGEPIREIQVNVDPRQLEAYNVTVEQIGGILAAENINLPSGSLKMGQSEYPLRFTGEFQESDVIKRIVIGNFNGKPVSVSDIAEVKDTLREMTIEERIEGRKGLRMVIQRQSGSNTVNIAKEVTKQLPAIRESLPPDVELKVIVDLSQFIVGAINNLTSILYYAALFVLVVVLFFIGRWRATFIIIITIPVSLIAAFIYLYLSGNTLNMISLSSLAIAMGMVVDDAIVVLENIAKHINRGSRPKEAAVYATNEVGMAVVASTLTVVAVFLPLTMITGLTGLFFRQLGYIVTITVSISTIAALSLTPMLSSKLLTKKSNSKNGIGKSIRDFINRILDGLDNMYVSTLRKSMRNKWLVVVLAFAIFASSMFLMRYIGTGFMPEADQNVVSAKIELPIGVRLEETSKTARAIEDIIVEKYPEAYMYYVSSGYSTSAMFLMAGSSGSNVIDILMRLKPIKERDRDVWQIAESLREDFKSFPEIVKYSVATTGGGPNMGGAPVSVEIYGQDFNETNTFAYELSQRMQNIPGVRDISISRGEERPELRIIPDQEKMSLFGLNTHTVSNAIRNRVEGMTATRFREDGYEYNVVIRHKEEFRNTISDIENISVRNPMGRMVKVKEFATVEEFFAPPNIERKNRVRYLSVNCALHNISLGDVTADIQAEVAKMDIPQGIDIAYGGQVKDQMEAFSDLLLLLALAIFLVYIVMAAQFESFRTPFIIMLAVPFAFTGVMLALYITGTELSVIALIGAVILVGIVVKNSIVLIDYTNLLRARGYTVVQSVVQAGRSRLRPVLMTTLTTVLAMIPMAMSTGEGSEIWKPMGVAVIGGLTFSTIITMVFVPVAYALLGAMKVRKQKRKLANAR
ncbi:MAG: efflux RND transporter permease subunit [Bacteroidetes bacterium]|nr:efflux RND transporter permease subunit [Bacteroidota bacterium]